MPVKITSWRDRNSWTYRLGIGPVIHCEVPSFSAILASCEEAILTVTNGRPCIGAPSDNLLVDGQYHLQEPLLSR